MPTKATRQVIYIAQEPNTGIYWIAGVTFREFMEAVNHHPNLLMLRHESGEGLPIHEVGNDYLPSEEVGDLMQDNIYGWGDFWWIDVSGVEEIRKLPKQKIAELAYLSKLGTAYDSPWFSTLKNKFIYMGHDDGWLLRLYARPTNLKPLLVRLIQLKAKKLFRIDASIASQTVSWLLRYSSRGLALDFRNPRQKQISVYAVGFTQNIDSIQNRDWNISPSNRIAELKAHSRVWQTLRDPALNK
jgi:hypothetical protein